MTLTIGMRVRIDGGEECHVGKDAVYEVYEDDGVLMLKCRWCGDTYSVEEYADAGAKFVQVES